MASRRYTRSTPAQVMPPARFFTVTPHQLFVLLSLLQPPFPSKHCSPPASLPWFNGESCSTSTVTVHPPIQQPDKSLNTLSLCVGAGIISINLHCASPRYSSGPQSDKVHFTNLTIEAVSRLQVRFVFSFICPLSLHPFNSVHLPTSLTSCDFM